jgi:hypothetical protein
VVSTTPVIQPHADELVFLIGRPPMSEFIGYVTTQTVGGQDADLRALAHQWRTANDHIHDLENREAGLADGAIARPLDPGLETLRELVLTDPFFQRSFALIPASLGLVELDRLVVFQKQINLTYASTLEQLLRHDPSPDALFRFCLPFDHPQPPVNLGRISGNQFVFYSPSTDFRFLEATLLQPNQVTGQYFQGPVSGIVALMVGYGSNFLNVVQAEGRLILNNGSHRAYALRSLGVTHAPCVIQHLSRREELEFVGNQDLQSKPDLYLRAARPPLLKDYFDPHLRSVLRVPRRSRQVKITFGLEVLDVPIA